MISAEFSSSPKQQALIANLGWQLRFTFVASSLTIDTPNLNQCCSTHRGRRIVKRLQEKKNSYSSHSQNVSNDLRSGCWATPGKKIMADNIDSASIVLFFRPTIRDRSPYRYHFISIIRWKLHLSCHILLDLGMPERSRDANTDINILRI